jgi:NADP-dependent 3-hydroxy acid dehydrogenase YdfG
LLKILNHHILTMEKNKFKDKVVVITGASAGIGRVTAWEFAKQGAKVVLLARSTEQLEGAKKEVEEYGGKALTIVTDVADAAQVISFEIPFISF